MNYYNAVRAKLRHSKFECGYLKAGIPITFRDTLHGYGDKYITEVATNVALKGNSIIVDGNNCQQVDVSYDEDLLKKIYDSLVTY